MLITLLNLNEGPLYFCLLLGKPLIVVRGTRSRSLREIPAIDITFANGVEDSLVLERFYPTQQSRRAKTLSCNFFGHLKNEHSGCVSLTGCPGKENLYFTINSINSAQSNKFILEQNGNLQVVDGVFKVLSFYFNQFFTSF